MKKISNSDMLSGSSLPGISRMVQLEIVIGGHIIRHFKYFKLRQSTVTHHFFELILAHDVLDEVQDHHLKEAQKFLGSRITVIFKYRDLEKDSPERCFTGVITQVAFSQEEMSLGDLVLKGGSPTLLMDAAPHFQSFGGEKPVNTSIIADNIMKQSLPSGMFDVRIDTRSKSYINYSAQYHETHYNYLSRIAQAYGEHFYYDGEVLHFGKLPAPEKALVLAYGSSVRQVRVKLNAAYTRSFYFGYNSSSDRRMSGLNSDPKHVGELASQAYEINKHIYKSESLLPVPLSANMELDIDDSQKSVRGSSASGVFTVSGKTTVPFLYPGCIADIEMRRPGTSQTSYFTRLMITEVSHIVDALGNYTGKFKSIAEGTGFLPRPELIVSRAEPQLATVVSNSDPLSQGRIQVRFDWQSEGSTHFIRMMSPDAGGTDAVQQNRGFVAVPEVGDQVMVGFEYSHPDFPFAMGGMFHGKNGQGGGIDNHLKSIQTRSGIKVLLNDTDKSVTLHDPSGNTYFMDGAGNIRVSAPKSITFNAGEDITMNAGKNLEVKTGNSMEFMSGNLAAFHMISGAMFSTPFMEMSVPVHFNIQSGKTTLLSEEETVIQGRTTHVAGMDKLMIHSEQETTVNSRGQTQVLGKDGNNLSNIPRDFQPLQKEMDGRYIAHFRPMPNWSGEGYGFDWVRAGDTDFPGDVPYSQITGKIQDGTFVKSRGQYLKLIATFSYYVYNHTDESGNTVPKSYAYPYLSLYPRTYFRKINGESVRKNSLYTNTTARLTLLINIKEAAQEVTLKYDTKKFQIIHDPFPLTEGNHQIPVTITCMEELSLDRKIELFASYKAEDGSVKKMLAGGLTVKANKKRFDIPVVFIEVLTDIGNQKKYPLIGSREHEIQKFLNHALINPVFKGIVSLDCSVDVNIEKGIRHNRKSRLNAIAALERRRNGNMALNADNHNNEVIKFLKDELHSRYPGAYDNVVKIFFMNEHCRGAAGYAIFEYKTAVLFDGGYNSPDRSVTTHEIMHAMGLHHTFESKSKFVFEKYETDNLMDYSDVLNDNRRKHAITTSHWQWKILQENAQIEASSSRFKKFENNFGNQYIGITNNLF